MNDNAETTEAAPILAVVSVEAWGVSPDGAQAQMLVQTATQKIRIAMDFAMLSNMIVTMKAALRQCERNALEAGGEKSVQAIPINGFALGHAGEGVLIVIDHKLPSEVVFVLPAGAAIDFGKKLMAEGQLTANLARDKGIAKPEKPKLILPRDVH